MRDAARTSAKEMMCATVQQSIVTHEAVDVPTLTSGDAHVVGLRCSRACYERARAALVNTRTIMILAGTTIVSFATLIGMEAVFSDTSPAATVARVLCSITHTLLGTSGWLSMHQPVLKMLLVRARYVCACMCACERASVRASVRACVHERMHVCERASEQRASKRASEHASKCSSMQARERASQCASKRVCVRVYEQARMHARARARAFLRAHPWDRVCVCMCACDAAIGSCTSRRRCGWPRVLIFLCALVKLMFFHK